MLKKIENRIILFALLTAVVYILLVIYTETDKILSSILQISFSSLLLLLFMIIISFIFKYFRWKYYLIKSGIRLKGRDQIIVFLSGFIMTFSPGKIGELIKSLLIKKKYDYNYSETLPAVISERIIEFFSLIIIFIFGQIYFDFDLIYIIITGLLLGIFIITIFNKSFLEKITRKIGNFSYFREKISDFELFTNNISMLFSLKSFLIATLLSVSAWIFEFLGFYVIIAGLENSLNFVLSGFIYCSSIVFGAVSMLPGGIGTTEAALSYLLIDNGLSENVSVAATIIIRLATLWFAIIIGFLALIYYIKKDNVIIDS